MQRFAGNLNLVPLHAARGIPLLCCTALHIQQIHAPGARGSVLYPCATQDPQQIPTPKSRITKAFTQDPLALHCMYRPVHGRSAATERKMRSAGLKDAVFLIIVTIERKCSDDQRLASMNVAILTHALYRRWSDYRRNKGFVMVCLSMPLGVDFRKQQEDIRLGISTLT